MSFQYDLTVVGAGPAGYVAAIRAAQLGMKVALVEGRKELGGTCLNEGCIPSKALLDSSDKYEQSLRHFKDHGIEVEGVKLNLKQMLARKSSVVKTLTGGIAMLMKKNKIDVVTGWAKLQNSNKIAVGKQVLTSKNILIASGSVAVELPFAKFDGKTIVSSTEALDFTSVPKHLIVIGAGVIGLELGSVWRRLGSKVSVIDIAESPLAIMDQDLAKESKKIFEKQGVSFLLSAKVKEVKTTKTGAKVAVEKADGSEEILSGDKVLVCVGRRPNTSNLGLAEAGVELDERGFIKVDSSYQTSLKNVYAAGDCLPGPMLAHKGEEEGIACVEMLAGQAGHVNYNAIPSVVYTDPEVAGVGLTEQECKTQGLDIKIGKFNFRANGRALAVAETDGFVKIIADKKTDKLLGCHIIGAHASDLIAEAVTVIEFGGSAEDIARTVHAHPTLSETVKEAALAVDKNQIHG